MRSRVSIRKIDLVRWSYNAMADLHQKNVSIFCTENWLKFDIQNVTMWTFLGCRNNVKSGFVKYWYAKTSFSSSNIKTQPNICLNTYYNRRYLSECCTNVSATKLTCVDDGLCLCGRAWRNVSERPRCLKLQRRAATGRRGLNRWLSLHRMVYYNVY